MKKKTMKELGLTINDFELIEKSKMFEKTSSVECLIYFTTTNHWWSDTFDNDDFFEEATFWTLSKDSIVDREMLINDESYNFYKLKENHA